MNVTVTGQHIEITPAIREFVVDKLERVKRHFDHPIDVSVILTIEKLNQHVEANVHINGRDLFVEASNPDMYVAIDELVHTLDRQIIRHKEKQHDQRNGQPIKHMASN